MRVCTLASGSSGNSLLIETEETKILVDAGISLRQIKLRLAQLGVEADDIDAVIVTHEHSDHTAAIPRLKTPVHVASQTSHLWKEKLHNMVEFASDCAFSVRDLLITPFSVPHDALDPVGFTIESGKGEKIGLVTDIGSVTGLVKERLKGCNILVLEFNHCSDILLYSHYPWDLKQRIKGRLGHLSNIQGSELLQSLLHGGLKHVVLAHLSQVNNKPEAALKAASEALTRFGAENDVGVSVAPRKTIGEVLAI
jgi:phosphoribosyl 1,2-cyclic phosphodiesterase